MSKNKKTNKEVWNEAKKEGLFSEAIKMSKVKKKYKFNSFIDFLVSIAVIILALVVITWVRNW